MSTRIDSAADSELQLLGPETCFQDLEQARQPDGPRWLSHDLRWLEVLRVGLRQVPYCVQVRSEGRVLGQLPLMYVRSRLFGRYLVSLPYLNSGGVRAECEAVAGVLIDQAVRLADRLDVKRLELRHETERFHAALTETMTGKVHMRLPLPASSDLLWKLFKPKVRNQIRKGDSQQFTVQWGTHEALEAFYAVFSRNMRDLGTPVFGRGLFRGILDQFPESAEFCVVRQAARPVAAALLLHGQGVTEVPSASSLRACSSTNANMWMYWQLLSRAIERGQQVFDFGRSSRDSNTWRFKKQWGAEPHPAVWQYYVREGSVGEMRPEHPRMQRAIRVWRRLPLWLANTAGPEIVRGIP